jgi:hypothetical protein
MKFIAFALLLTICIATAFGADSSSSMITGTGAEIPNVTALQSMVANSSANLQSYRFIFETDQSMEVFNLSGLNNSYQVIQIKGLGHGSVNLTAKSVKLVMANLILPLGIEDDSSVVAVEEYLVNDTIYLKTDGNWTQIKLPIADLWTDQDRVEQQLQLLNNSNITFLGMEKVGSQECYKVGLSPDMAAYSKIVSEQMGGFPANINLSQLYNNSVMQITYWINKESYLLEKTEVYLAISMTPQSLGVTPKGPEKQEIRQLINTTMSYFGYDKPVNIKLPPQAQMAKELPLSSNSP